MITKNMVKKLLKEIEKKSNNYLKYSEIELNENWDPPRTLLSVSHDNYYYLRFSFDKDNNFLDYSWHCE
jgi:hypothetical protein